MAGAVIIGVGPGIGQAVARRFAREGLPLGLVARSEETVRAAAGAIGEVPVVTRTADATDDVGLRSALDEIAGKFGTPDVVVYNAALIRPDEPAELSLQGHMDAWAVNVGGALTAAAHVAPAMAERGRGTFLITGGMPEPKHQYTSLSLGKAGVRTLVALLDQKYGPSGVHAASITVAGPVAPGTDFDPDDIAEHYWRLHTQEPHEWESEAYHGP
ncbi:SDR family NAD(P)-dependent oxidoreductase [Actinomadura darangshiensis]|uniref:SDR family NAD(P)-dependent oxidoreductase n=1 Tax=Actinomadura darangshiensis TaxID=705336 RepID=A0A4R5B4H0_9ACTN|nr:SDR family NAD(P)-dependent oxidoreductase [Actinomadura darangshiensis]TDD79873.1 SDR family NAD(P)-dependent oxidoreductase [Actinomadura darangshiensis]